MWGLTKREKCLWDWEKLSHGLYKCVWNFLTLHIIRNLANIRSTINSLMKQHVTLLLDIVGCECKVNILYLFVGDFINIQWYKQVG